MAYYDKLIEKWPELGPPAISDFDVNTVHQLYALPQPAEPAVQHWTQHGLRYDDLGVVEKHQTDNDQHAQYQRDIQAWRMAWASVFFHPGVQAKLDKLNKPIMVPAGKVPSGRYILVETDDQGRQILEPEMVNSDTLVPSPNGDGWWARNGYSSPISHTDLEAVFVKHGKLLV